MGPVGGTGTPPGGTPPGRSALPSAAPPWHSASLGALSLLVAALALAGPPAVWALAGAPVVEEIVLRAGLQDSLDRWLSTGSRARRLSPRPAAWLSLSLTALAFAVAHVLTRPGLASLATVVPAVVIGAVYRRQRRLLPCVLLHALFNGIWLFARPTLPSFESVLPWIS